MWDWIKDASKKLVTTGVAYLEDRAFISSLMNMQQQQAYLALQKKIEEMDDPQYKSFCGTLAGMIIEAQQALNQASNSNSSPWGNSFEDRLAYGMAKIQSGESARPDTTQQQMYLQGLNAVALFANQFYQQKPVRANPTGLAGLAQGGAQFPPTPSPSPLPQPAAPAQQHPATTDTSDIERMLDEFAQNGKLDPAMMQKFLSLTDEGAIDRITAKLKEMGATEGSSQPLNNIESYYQPGAGSYELKWPLSPGLPLPVRFDQLDRKMQFFVLFQEWSRRELEGNQALNSGDTTGATAIFDECLARAEQLEVAELKARSFEGMMRVAQKTGKRQDERKWVKAALAARESD